jgi:hypothetical protein
MRKRFASSLERMFNALPGRYRGNRRTLGEFGQLNKGKDDDALASQAGSTRKESA